jgi:hypothetical protein
LLDAIDDYRDQITTALDEYREAALPADDDREAQIAFLNDLAKKMRPPPLVQEIERVVLDHHPRYAEMVADQRGLSGDRRPGRSAHVPDRLGRP